MNHKLVYYIEHGVGSRLNFLKLKMKPDLQVFCVYVHVYIK